jgi:hypothetical protein
MLYRCYAYDEDSGTPYQGSVSLCIYRYSDNAFWNGSAWEGGALVWLDTIAPDETGLRTYKFDGFERDTAYLFTANARPEPVGATVSTVQEVVIIPAVSSQSEDSLAHQVAQYLGAEEITTFDPLGIAGNTFISVLPDTPDDAVMIRSTGGARTEGHAHYDNPSLQIIVRGGLDPRPPELLARRIYDALHGIRHRRLVDGGWWVQKCLGVQSGPVYIGQDTNRRHEYSLNFDFRCANEARR